MPECVVRGIRLYYQASSSLFKDKTPVLFIHGSGGSAHVWSHQIKFEVPGYVHIALDLPGHARSQGNGEDTVLEYALWIKDFMQCMGLTSCVLGGHSLGGAITMMSALTFPEFLRGIILVGTGARLRVAEDVLIRARRGASFAEYAYSSDTPISVKREAESEFRLTSPEVRYRDFLACDRFDIMERVHEIALPALIICGQEDKLTPVKYSQFLHQKIFDSRLEIIPKAGHMVMWEQPEDCNQAIQDFLNRL